RARAEGMNVHGDRAWQEMEIGPGKWSGHTVRVPAVVKCAVRHWVRLRKQVRRIFVYQRNAGAAELVDDRSEPLIAERECAAGAVVRAVYIGAAAQTVFLRGNRVDDHSPHRLGTRRIEPAHE